MASGKRYFEIKLQSESKPEAKKGFELTVTSKEFCEILWNKSRLEIIAAVLERNPSSLAKLAKHVGRPISQVETHVHDLVEVGFLTEGSGSARRPTVPWDGIRITL
jgi:predicted transcriptional regulator